MIPDCHCDHCEGVEWPAGPPITMEQVNEISASMRMFGRSMADYYDKSLTAMFKL